MGASALIISTYTGITTNDNRDLQKLSSFFNPTCRKVNSVEICSTVQISGDSALIEKNVSYLVLNSYDGKVSYFNYSTINNSSMPNYNNISRSLAGNGSNGYNSIMMKLAEGLYVNPAEGYPVEY